MNERSKTEYITASCYDITRKECVTNFFNINFNKTRSLLCIYDDESYFALTIQKIAL